MGKREAGRGGWEGTPPPSRVGKRRSRWAEFVGSCGISEEKKDTVRHSFACFRTTEQKEESQKAVIKRTQMFRLLHPQLSSNWFI